MFPPKKTFTTTRDKEDIEELEVVPHSQTQKNSFVVILKEFRNRSRNHSNFLFGSSTLWDFL